MPTQQFGPDGRPLPAQGYWSDPTRTDVGVGSTGNTGFDFINYQAGANIFGNMNQGGGAYSNMPGAGAPQRAPQARPGQSYGQSAMMGRRQAAMRRMKGMMDGGGGA